MRFFSQKYFQRKFAPWYQGKVTTGKAITSFLHLLRFTPRVHLGFTLLNEKSFVPLGKATEPTYALSCRYSRINSPIIEPHLAVCMTLLRQDRLLTEVHIGRCCAADPSNHSHLTEGATITFWREATYHSLTLPDSSRPYLITLLQSRGAEGFPWPSSVGGGRQQDSS